ncbi:hypothetical protein B0T20DRAFT_494381 [Sordaria brevicollis]|uniref:Kinetochore protein mis14 n=1 Tax=Sordaria brevicollis TaxID=83679 RepID=A0AAE0PIE2_SORBR|nr:hypothetical protein B0T20DRAFT_494381 [Sordaria brevicollis]
MESSTVHRRIELQSPEDFTYLIDNVRRAAADSINAAFPPVDSAREDDEEDELRVRIEGLVNDYITKTFTLVAPNISINGLPVSDPSEFLSLPSSPLNSPATTNGRKPTTTKKSKSKITKNTRSKKQKPQEEYEPFDPRKRSRLESLAREEEDLLRSIALLKRRVPASTASSFAQSLARQAEEDQKALEAAKQRVIEEGVLSGRKALEGLLPSLAGEQGEEIGGDGEGQGDGQGGRSVMERQEGIEDGFGKAVEALRRLKSQMPATVARMERARVAGGYVVGASGEGR